MLHITDHLVPNKHFLIRELYGRIPSMISDPFLVGFPW